MTTLNNLIKYHNQNFTDNNTKLNILNDNSGRK